MFESMLLWVSMAVCVLAGGSALAAPPGGVAAADDQLAKTDGKGELDPSPPFVGNPKVIASRVSSRR